MTFATILLNLISRQTKYKVILVQVLYLQELMGKQNVRRLDIRITDLIRRRKPVGELSTSIAHIRNVALT